MADMVLLVDLENVQKVDLSRIPASARVKIFVGALQTKLPTTLVQQAQALGSRLEWVRIDGNGSNALDFHIACHLGEGLARTPQAEFVILSRDKGFDPLLRHLEGRGMACRRVEDPVQIVLAAMSSADANTRQVLELLGRTEKSKRPRKRATLINYLLTHFGKKTPTDDVKRVIDRLFEMKLIAGTEAALVYHF
jgi:hypothetical protein